MSELNLYDLNLISDPLFFLNEELRFTRANDSYLKFSSSSMDDLINRPFFLELNPLGAHGEILTAFQKCLTLGEKTHVKDFCLQTARWVEYHVSPCLAGGLSVLVSDITEEFKVKERTANEEKRWRSILEGSALGHIQMSLDGRCLYVNARAGEILDQNPAELIGKSYKDFFQREEVETAEQKLLELITEGHKNFSTEHPILRKDGRDVWVRLSVSLVRTREGHPHFFVAAIDNIDERKEVEESLNFALQAAKMGDWDFDAIQNSTRRSEKFNKIYGYDKAPLNWCFDDFSGHVHPEDRHEFTRSFLKILSSGKDFKIETRIIWPDKSVHWISLGGRVYQDRKGRAVRMAGLIVDITDEKMAAQDIQQARLAAEDANREKSYFLANMSHEIRTPLAAILGFTEALRDPTVPEDERHRYLGILSRNGKNLANLINDILDLSKVEAGFLQIDHRKTNLRDLIDEVTTLLRITAEAKNLKLIVHAEGILPQYILADGVRLRQILMNVIGNAIKFTEHGEIHVFMTSASADGEKASHLIFRVKDTGTGISPAAAKKLFSPFMQADSSTTRKFGGTGLGLALSRRLAHAMGGDLVLEQSQLGKGSTFTITLPLIDAPAEEIIVANANHQAVQNAQNYRGLKGLKVLVADDSLDNQELIVRMLDKHGAQIELADDGVQAVEKALNNDYDIVLMDMQMPNLDGYSAARELRRAGFLRPILALTANAMRSDREKCIAAGCSEYLSKPIEAHKLYQLMGSLTETFPH